MKKMFLVMFLAGSSLAVHAQKEKYEATMTELVGILQNEYEKSLMPTINKVERVANAEAKEWLPQYWVAYGLVKESYLITNAAEKDVVLDKAEEYLAKASALSPKNAEIEVLKAYFSSARLVIDPMARWQKYGALFEQHLGEADKLDPQNPRADYLRATNLFYTPEAFGGGKEKAKPYFESTLKKFEAFQSPNSYSPVWGKMEAEYFLKQ
ncbi:MAG: hypothetical protein LRY55_07950 [Leadbetterella sp.]|nr:hypothetical protein [Leadbetterella sp.]